MGLSAEERWGGRGGKSLGRVGPPTKPSRPAMIILACFLRGWLVGGVYGGRGGREGQKGARGGQRGPEGARGGQRGPEGARGEIWSPEGRGVCREERVQERRNFSPGRLREKPKGTDEV